MILCNNCHEAIATRPIGDPHIDGWINGYRDEQAEVYRSIAPPTYSHLSKVLVKHFSAGAATTFLITKIAVTQQQLLYNKK